MSSDRTEELAFIRRLVSHIPEFKPTADADIDYWGQVLPHVVMGEFTRWCEHRIHPRAPSASRGDHEAIQTNQHTVDDVKWLRDIADEYVAHWERNLRRLRQMTQAKRSTSWSASPEKGGG